MSALSRIEELQSARRAVPRPSDRISRVVIVGGGSAGWMAATTLSQALGQACSITLIESEALGTVGVGEATIPSIRMLNRMMGIQEKAFMQRTQATFKLGIDFVNWGRPGHRYFHGFGFFGEAFDTMPVHQHWLRQRHRPDVGELEDYCLSWQMARRDRFSHPMEDTRRLQSTFNYAYHFDAGLYAGYLREVSTERGVQRVEGIITHVHQDPENGFVTRLVLQDGREIEGDLFIDCSGFRSILLGHTLKVGYESWAHWLPCDRAVALPCERRGPPRPYTRATARAAGWQWTIPLRHRVGNGYVYASAFAQPDHAEAELQGWLEGPALAGGNHLKFTAGRRHKAWVGNVVALGLASGFLEPLESTSLHLVHSGLTTLLALFPDRHFHRSVQNEFNRRFAMEMERIRDFLVLHYKLNQRDDTELWRYCAHMSIPDSLQERMELFRHGGHLQLDHADLFGAESWLMVHIGQFNIPQSCSPMVDLRNFDGHDALLQLRRRLEATAQAMPTQEEFLGRYLVDSPTRS